MCVPISFRSHEESKCKTYTKLSQNWNVKEILREKQGLSVSWCVADKAGYVCNFKSFLNKRTHSCLIPEILCCDHKIPWNPWCYYSYIWFALGKISSSCKVSFFPPRTNNLLPSEAFCQYLQEAITWSCSLWALSEH